jgi:hypothetical protein
MIQTRDITTIIVMAVLQFVLAASVVQMGTLITGIAGASFLFTIILAIPISFSVLMYEGRRWRIFIQLTLFTLLAMPTTIGGTPFNPAPRLSSLATAFLIDVIANSFYGFFKQHSKMLGWAILTSTLYWIMTPFLKIVVSSVFYTPEFVESFTNVVLCLLPIIIAEAIIGGYIGHKIYNYQSKPNFEINKYTQQQTHPIKWS